MSASGTLAYPKPAKGSAKKLRRRKRAELIDKDYRDWIHQQRCLVPGCRKAVEMHHERNISGHDHDAVPLCVIHHRGRGGRHGLRSLDGFELKYGLNVRQEIANLRARYLAETGRPK